MATKTMNLTTTMSPENVIAQAVNSIVGGRWRVQTQGPRNAVFILEENKFNAFNLLTAGCLLIFLVIPGLIVLAILALRQPRVQARITLTTLQEGDTTTIIAQVEGRRAEAKVQEFLATLSGVSGLDSPAIDALPANVNPAFLPVASGQRDSDALEQKLKRFMTEFLNTIKKGAARTQLEAEKLVYVNQLQGQASALRQQILQSTAQLGEKSLELYRAGQLPESDLMVLCEELVALEKEIAEKEVEIETIRQESLPEDIAVTPAIYGHLCPQCKINLPEEADFCPNCGSKVVDIPPLEVVGTALKCNNCGATLATEAQFCPECGTKIEIRQEIAELPGAVCPECHSPLPEGAVFCTNCGTKVEELRTRIPEEKGQTPVPEAEAQVSLSEIAAAPEEEESTPSESSTKPEN